MWSLLSTLAILVELSIFSGRLSAKYKLIFNWSSPINATLQHNVFFLPSRFILLKNPFSELSKPRCGTANAESPWHQHSS